MVDRWACDQTLCQAHLASQEPGLPSLPSPPILACKVLLYDHRDGMSAFTAK